MIIARSRTRPVIAGWQPLRSGFEPLRPYFGPHQKRKPANGSERASALFVTIQKKKSIQVDACEPLRKRFWRSCQTRAKASLSDTVWPLRSGLSRNGLPLSQCGGEAMLVGLAIDGMAFSVEVVVDGGVN